MEVLKKATLEALRLLVLALIPVSIPMIQAWAIDWKMLATVGIITVLRFIDKALHEAGKELEDEDTRKDPITSVLTKGLVRF